MSVVFKPEGLLMDTPDNINALRSLSAIQDSFVQGKILEARAILCDHDHNLIVDMGPTKGIIYRSEGALGINEGTTRDIALISRVNKAVAFKIIGFEKWEDGSICPVLSRRSVQKACLEYILKNHRPGDILDARVTHLEPFGCFVDIGCGIASLIPIDAISISRISHPRDRFKPNQDIKVIIKSIEEDGRINLSHKELLGTWQQNADNFKTGETVAGIVRSVEDYGVFVELAPNLAGLAEPKEGILPGQHASVYIKNLIPEKMKVKLIIVDSFDAKYQPSKLKYYIDSDHLDEWIYSPAECNRVIKTNF